MPLFLCFFVPLFFCFFSYCDYTLRTRLILRTMHYILRTRLILYGCHPLILCIHEPWFLTVPSLTHHNIDLYYIQCQISVLYTKCWLSSVSGKTMQSWCFWGFFSDLEIVNDILKNLASQQDKQMEPYKNLLWF